MRCPTSSTHCKAINESHLATAGAAALRLVMVEPSPCLLSAHDIPHPAIASADRMVIGGAARLVIADTARLVIAGTAQHLCTVIDPPPASCQFD